MRTVIVISRCLDDREGRVNFHFKGFYAGEEIKALRLEGVGNGQWRRNEEYVMYVKVLKVEAGTLYGEVLRQRLLDDLRD